MSDNDVRVLVVDDVEDNALLLAQLLIDDGYVVRTALGGAEALAVTPTFLPHCVLLDVNMPGMDGFELSRHLRATYGDDIVLIAVTGGSADDLKVSGTFDLVDHYLIKPIELSRLMKILPSLRSSGPGA